MSSKSSGRVNSTSTSLTIPNVFRCPGYYVVFVFEEVEAFMASGTQWTEIVRAIERSTVPPVFDKEAAAVLNGMKKSDSRRFHGLPFSMSFRGYFAIQSFETILDLKIRVLHEIRHSSKARRWWRRHMGNPIPLYAKSTPQKISIGENLQDKKTDSSGTGPQKQNEDNSITTNVAPQNSQYLTNQGKGTQRIGDSQTNNLQTLGKIISNITVSPAGKSAPQQKFKEFEVKMNEIEDMIPKAEEPDLSDLESTSYDQSDYDEEINIGNEEEERNKISKSNKKKKRGYKKKKKQIQYNNFFNPYMNHKRTPRIQPEDFICYSCLIKPPEGELQGANIRNSSIQQLRPIPKPISPYVNKQSIVQTELFPAFSPFAATYELPPPPEINPHFSIINNNNQNQPQPSFPQLRSLASESYTQFRSHKKPNQFSLNAEIGDNYNTLVTEPITCYDYENSLNKLQELYTTDKQKIREENCIDKREIINPDLFPYDNRIPLLIFCVPGQIHVFDTPNEQKNENNSTQNEDDIDLKGEICIVMTQGRKLMNQLIIPKEMPFINAVRLLSLTAYPSHDIYSSDIENFQEVNSQLKSAGRVCSHNEDGQICLLINRYFLQSNDAEQGPYFDPVYQPEEDEYEYETKQEMNENDNQEKRIKRRNQMKRIFNNNLYNYYSEGLKPYTSVWEMWCDMKKKVVGGRILNRNRGNNNQQQNSSQSQLNQQSQSSTSTSQNTNNIPIDAEQELYQLEQQRYKRLCGIAEWEETGGGPGSGGAMLQTSIHMSVAHAGESIELLEQSKNNIIEHIKKLTLRIKEQINNQQLIAYEQRRENDEDNELTPYSDDNAKTKENNEDIPTEQSQDIFYSKLGRFINFDQQQISKDSPSHPQLYQTSQFLPFSQSLLYNSRQTSRLSYNLSSMQSQSLYSFTQYFRQASQQQLQNTSQIKSKLNSQQLVDQQRKKLKDNNCIINDDLTEVEEILFWLDKDLKMERIKNITNENNQKALIIQSSSSSQQQDDNISYEQSEKQQDDSIPQSDSPNQQQQKTNSLLINPPQTQPQQPLIEILNKEQKKKLREIYQLGKIFKLILRIEKENAIQNMNAQNKNEIMNNNSKMNDVLLDIYQLFFPDELYLIWLTHIGEIGIGKQLQEDWQNKRKQFENRIQKWVKIQLGLIKQRNRNEINPLAHILFEPEQIDPCFNMIYQYVKSALSRALIRILKFDLTTEDIIINKNDIEDENLNNQIQIYGNDNDDEEDGIVFDDADAIISWEKRNKDDEEQSIIQTVKENMNRPRFHPLNPSFRSKQRVFRVIEEMEEELDTTFVTLNVIWNKNRFEDTRQNIIYEINEKGKQIDDDIRLNRIDDDYPTIFGGGGMWSRRWGKFPKLNKSSEKQRNEEQSSSSMTRNLEKKTDDDQQKNLRFFIGKCNPELLAMRTVMKGLWESGTRRIPTNQRQSDNSLQIIINSNLTPFPRVLQSFSSPHAPLVPCNHKCGIVGNVHVWKRMFVVHSHRGHNRNFQTRAKMVTRKQLDDIFETNIATIQQWKSKDQIDKDEQLKDNNNTRLIYQIMLLIIQYLSGFGEGTHMLTDLKVSPEDIERMEIQLNNLLSQTQTQIQSSDQSNEYQQSLIVENIQQNITPLILKSMSSKSLLKLFQEMIILLNTMNNQENITDQNQNSSQNQQLSESNRDLSISNQTGFQHITQSIISTLSKQQLIQATKQIQSLSINNNQNQSSISLSLANVNLDQIPENPFEQQNQISPQEKWLKFIQDKLEHPKPIFILKGAAWDNYHRKGRSFYSCSETSATFGQMNQIFDPRYPVFALQRFKSLTKFYFPKIQPTNNPPIIKLPQFSSDLQTKFKQILENREKMNQDRQIGKENEIQCEGIISFEEVIRFKNEIRQLINKDLRKLLKIFQNEDFENFIKHSHEYYEEVEKKLQHIDIDVHFGSKIKINSNQNQEEKDLVKEKETQQITIENNSNSIIKDSQSIENEDENQLIDNIELINKQGLLIVGDIHGNFNALLKVLDIVDDVLLRNSPSRGKVVFLGDYIDRGIHSLECAILIIAYKLAFPNRVFLLRGNHESVGTRIFCYTFNLRIHTFFDSKLRNLFFENPQSNQIKGIKMILQPFTKAFIKLFTNMPISCTATLLYHYSNQVADNIKTQDLPKNQSQRIRENQTQILDQTTPHNSQPLHPIIHSRRIQLTHGGITPIMPVASLEDECPSMEAEDQYHIAEQLGYECDEVWTRNRALLKFTTWGDPSHLELIDKGRPPFCQETTDRYVRANGIDTVVRAHQDAKHGFYFPMHNGKVATIFSSDTYCQCNTKGSVFLVRLSSPSERFNQDPFINSKPTTRNSLISKTSQSLSSQTNSQNTSSLPFSPLLTFDTIQLESEDYLKKFDYSLEDVEEASREKEEKRVLSAMKRIQTYKQADVTIKQIEKEIESIVDISQIVNNSIAQIGGIIDDGSEQMINGLTDIILENIISNDEIKTKFEQAEHIIIHTVDGKRLVLHKIRKRIKEQILFKMQELKKQKE